MKQILFFALLFTHVIVFAQQQLEYEDRSRDNDLFGGQPNEACVTLSFSQTMLPVFIDNGTRQKPTSIDSVGEVVNYNFVYKVKDYGTRYQMSVNLDGFTPLPLSWMLKPKQWIQYFIYPDTTVVDCYHQLTREGLKLFQTGNYEEAKRKYEESKTCSKLSDENKEYVGDRLQLIDTLILWKNIANDYFTRNEYAKAIDYYSKIFEKNSTDDFCRKRMFESQAKKSDDCKINFDKAERYYNDNDMVNAELQYQKVVDQQCPDYMAQATQKLGIIIDRRNDICRNVLTYEYAKDAPIGFSIGSYKAHKASGYFTLRLNSEVFEAIRTNNDSTKRPELNVSFGWTIPIVKPVWIFFGPGYTGVGQYVVNNKDEQSNTQGKLDLKINSAISPEIGILAKFSLGKKIGIAVRYTFQYRFALDKSMQDYIGQTRHVFGVGICF